MATPLNDIIRNETTEYLNDIDPSNPPAPSTIETELLDKVNNMIEVENVGRPKKNQLPFLKVLDPAQIAQIMIKVHGVRRIPPAGRTASNSQSLLGFYVEPDPSKSVFGAEDPDAGLYATGTEMLRSAARLYNFSLKARDFTEVQTILLDEAPVAQRTVDRDLIAVNNGIFNFRTKKLLPFSRDMVFPSKSMVDYDANATSPTLIHPDGTEWEVEAWMRSLSDDPEIVELLWEILSAIIRPNVAWNKAAFLYSERGNNGKGTLVELMRQLCGPGTWASVPLADFGNDFLIEVLVRASAILVDENDVGGFLQKVAKLKAVITHDVISINRKYEKAIPVQFWGFMVQCVNEFPRSKDRSYSFYRRQLFVPMLKNFQDIERREIKDDFLKNPAVLRYVLHRVLHMSHYSLSEPEACKELHKEYMAANDPIRDYWDTFHDRFESWDRLPFAFLYALFVAWMARVNPSNKDQIISQRMFTSRLVEITANDLTWSSEHYKDDWRPGRWMLGEEPVATEYDLADWKAFNRVAMVRPKYRGLFRIGASTGDEDQDVSALLAEAQAQADGCTAHKLALGQNERHVVMEEADGTFDVSACSGAADLSLWDAATKTYNGQPARDWSSVSRRFGGPARDLAAV